MNNRSFGFDTECDLSMERRPMAEPSARDRRLRTDILAHWDARAVIDDAIAREQGVCKAIESLRARACAACSLSRPSRRRARP